MFVANARPFLTSMLVLSLLVARSGFGGGEEAAQEDPDSRSVTVKIENIKFVPSELVVAPGTTVKWVNIDPVAHDITSGVSVIGRSTRNMKQTKFPDDKFSSGLFGKDKSFSVTFDEQGEYPYYCNIHPFMIGKVVVE